MERQLNVTCSTQSSSTYNFDFPEAFVAVISSFTWILSPKYVITSLHLIYRIILNGLLYIYSSLFNEFVCKLGFFGMSGPV
jgi:hypothetical protein